MQGRAPSLKQFPIVSYLLKAVSTCLPALAHSASICHIDVLRCVTARRTVPSTVTCPDPFKTGAGFLPVIGSPASEPKRCVYRLGQTLISNRQVVRRSIFMLFKLQLSTSVGLSKGPCNTFILWYKCCSLSKIIFINYLLPTLG